MKCATILSTWNHKDYPNQCMKIVDCKDHGLVITFNDENRKIIDSILALKEEFWIEYEKLLNCAGWRKVPN